MVRFFSLSASSPVVMAHRMSGGIACLLRDNQLIEARDGKETVLPHADELPGSFGGAAIHLLANALAVCRAVGVRSRTSGSFAPFTPAESNPGRDRRDDLVAESAATVATWFSRVVVYEDRDLRGREAGQMTRLISGALARHRP